MFQLQEIKLLSVIDGKNLLDFYVEPPKFIIARFPPIGLHILSRSAKIGKGIAESTNIGEYGLDIASLIAGLISAICWLIGDIFSVAHVAFLLRGNIM